LIARAGAEPGLAGRRRPLEWGTLENKRFNDHQRCFNQLAFLLHERMVGARGTEKKRGRKKTEWREQWGGSKGKKKKNEKTAERGKSRYLDNDREDLQVSPH